MGSRWLRWQTRAQSQEVLGERLHLLLQRLQVLAADLRLEVELLEVVAGLDGVRGVWVGRLRRDRPGVGGVRPRGRRLGSRVGDWAGWPRWWQRTRPLILVARGGLRGELGLDLFAQCQFHHPSSLLLSLWPRSRSYSLYWRSVSIRLLCAGPK